jgi:hypothetical protein
MYIALLTSPRDFSPEPDNAAYFHDVNERFPA